MMNAEVEFNEDGSFKQTMWDEGDKEKAVRRLEAQFFTVENLFHTIKGIENQQKGLVDQKEMAMNNLKDYYDMMKKFMKGCQLSEKTKEKYDEFMKENEQELSDIINYLSTKPVKEETDSEKK